MDKFDRQLQNDILTACMRAYPHSADFLYYLNTSVEACWDLSNTEAQSKLHANLVYLAEHNLIKLNANPQDSPLHILENITATAKGIDFLLDDGGLGAILDVQTVRLHNDTLIALEDIIRVANIPEEQQKGLIAKLRDLPADALKHLTLQLLTQGILNLPHALQIIQTALRKG